MFFLAALVTATRQALRIEGSTFRDIININEIVESCDIMTKGITKRYSGKIGSPFKICNSSFMSISYSPTISVYGKGGAIAFSKITNIRIFNTSFENIDASDNGGSVYISDSTDIEFELCKFIKSSCRGYGGACSIERSATLTFTNNIYQECSADGKTDKYGGAIHVEKTSPLTFKSNRIENCYCNHYGGAVYFFTINNLISDSNTFIGDYTPERGGAIYIDTISNPVSFSNDNFDKCYTKLYGSGFFASGPTDLDIKFTNVSFARCFKPEYLCEAIYINNINSVVIEGIEGIECSTTSSGGVIYFGDVKTVSISNGKFNSCNATHLAGSIYFNDLTVIDMLYVTFSNCKANEGGALYFATKNKISISHASFISCSSNTDGGAIQANFSEKVEIEFTNFSGCSASGSGGGISITKGTTAVTFNNNIFESCTSYSGSSVYIYCTSLEFNSQNNIFSDSECTTHGAVYIYSFLNVNPKMPTFFNDSFSDCITKLGLGGNGIGGAIHLDIELKESANVQLAKCSYQRCSAYQSGAIYIYVHGTKLVNVVIELNGCEFSNCSAKDAACLEISSSSSTLVSFYITNYDTTSSSFHSLTGKTISHAIVADVSIIIFTGCEFHSLESIGLISAKCDSLTFSTSQFLSCKPIGNIINCDSTANVAIMNSSFKECKNCFQIVSVSMIRLIEVTFDDILEHTTTSSLTGDTVAIKNLIICNSKEAWIIDALEFVMEDSSLTNVTNKMELFYGKTSTYKRIAIIDNLTAINSQMFSINSTIDSLTLSNSCVFSNGTEAHLLVSSSKKTEISYCNFSLDSASSLLFSGGEASMSFCNVSVDGPAIETSTQLKLNQSTFASNSNPIFNIKEPNGKIILFKDSNCINKPFDETFTGIINVVDQDNKVIEKFYPSNNHCRDETPATPQSSPSLFEPTEIYITSEEKLSSHEPSYTKSFNEILYSSEIIHMKDSSEIKPTVEFKEFSSVLDFSEQQTTILESSIQNIETSYSKTYLHSSYHKIDFFESSKESSTILITSSSSQPSEINTGKAQNVESSVLITNIHESSYNENEITSYNKPKIEEGSSYNENLRTSSNTLNIVDDSSYYDNKMTSSTIKKFVENSSYFEDVKISSNKNQVSQKHTTAIKSTLITTLMPISQTKIPTETAIEKKSSILLTVQIPTITNQKITSQQSSMKHFIPSKTLEESSINEKSSNIRNSALFNNQENIVVEKSQQINTGIVAGIVVGVVVIIVISVVLVYLLVSKKKKKDQSDEGIDTIENETDMETCSSTDSYIEDYGTSYVTQENTNTMWVPGEKDLEFGLIIDDFEEMDTFN